MEKQSTKRTSGYENHSHRKHEQHIPVAKAGTKLGNDKLSTELQNSQAGCTAPSAVSAALVVPAIASPGQSTLQAKGQTLRKFAENACETECCSGFVRYIALGSGSFLCMPSDVHSAIAMPQKRKRAV